MRSMGGFQKSQTYKRSRRDISISGCLPNIAEMPPCAVNNLCDLWTACRNLTDGKSPLFDSCHHRASRNRNPCAIDLADRCSPRTRRMVALCHQPRHSTTGNASAADAEGRGSILRPGGHDSPTSTQHNRERFRRRCGRPGFNTWSARFTTFFRYRE